MSAAVLAGYGLMLAVLTVLAWYLSRYLYRLFEDERPPGYRLWGWLDRLIHRLSGVDPSQSVPWWRYLQQLLLFNLALLLMVYAILRLQGHLPLNQGHVPAMSPALAFNTAVSFVTNTNWQAYAGETSLSIGSQMWAITFLQVVAAATGVAMVLPVLRAFAGAELKRLGNFYRDVLRVVLGLLLPLSCLLAILWILQGMPATLSPDVVVHTLSGSMQTIARGPVASLEAIKMLGNNGGGFFNANAAHPFENPTPLTDVESMMAMGLLPMSLVFTLGRYLKNMRQAWVVYTVTTVALVVFGVAAYAAEAHGNTILHHLAGVLGPNWEGKETRFGIGDSSFYATITTAFTTGSVNAMHDSFTPLGGLVPLYLMTVNSVFGSVGAGLLNIIMFLIVTVFIAGLMVGRTPEIWGKKIEAREIKLASVAMLVHPLIVLVPTALALTNPAALASVANPVFHGLSEILYAFTSGAANNGSAFAGLNANTTFYNLAIGIVMLLGRYVSVIAMLALAGSVALKKRTPVTAGTLKTDTLAFGWTYVGVTVLVGALTFFPGMALGPLAEQLAMLAGRLYG
jgi:K+-transporting ATPase ATPase A chain